MKIRIQIDIDVPDYCSASSLYDKIHEVEALIEKEQDSKAPDFLSIVHDISTGWWWDVSIVASLPARKGGLSS